MGGKMKTKIIIETADELIKAFNNVRHVDDNFPIVPNDAKIIFDNGFSDVQLEAFDFKLDPSITVEDVIRAIAKKAGINILIT
jgi:hypothetical protein